MFLVSFACVATALAVEPPPDGGYANENTAEGEDALFSLTTGEDNTAVGFDALFSNTTGNNNTAVGPSTLGDNTEGANNTAIGTGSLTRNTTGTGNAAVGSGALGNNSTGKNNIALGVSAGFLLTTGSNNIDIFDHGVAGEANTIRLGKERTQKRTFIAGISGVTVADGVGIVIDTNGQLGTINSSARYKEAIKPMGDASDVLLSLKPVSFRYKKNLDPKAIPQFGLVAEQVEKVDPDLVARDDQGKPYSVRYEAVNAMLLNEFLKEHQKVEEQSGQLQAQGKEIEELKAAVTELKTARSN